MSDGAVAVARSSSPAVPYAEEQVRRWLGFLARNMQLRGQTIFLVESLQPTWVRNRTMRRLYFTISRSLVYVFAGLCLLAVSLALNWLRYYEFHAVWSVKDQFIAAFVSTVVSATLCLMLEMVLQAKLRKRKVDDPVLPRRRAITAFFFFGQVVLVVMAMPYISRGIVSLCYLCPILNTSIALHCGARLMEEDIQPVERLSWSWQTFRDAISPTKNWIAMLLIGILVVLGVRFGNSWMTTSLGILIFGALLVRAANKAFGGGLVPLKTRPNAGIWLSFRSAGIVLCMMFGIVAALLGSSLFLHGAWKEQILMGFFLLTPLAVSRAFVIGGTAVVDHFVLRGLLALYGYAPFQFNPFLDYVADHLGFLQKVGGGYVFMHRNLMEYFAGEVHEEALA